jgi:hypothetical protein
LKAGTPAPTSALGGSPFQPGSKSRELSNGDDGPREAHRLRRGWPVAGRQPLWAGPPHRPWSKEFLRSGRDACRLVVRNSRPRGLRSARTRATRGPRRWERLSDAEWGRLAHGRAPRPGLGSQTHAAALYSSMSPPSRSRRLKGAQNRTSRAHRSASPARRPPRTGSRLRCSDDVRCRRALASAPLEQKVDQVDEGVEADHLGRVGDEVRECVDVVEVRQPVTRVHEVVDPAELHPSSRGRRR